MGTIRISELLPLQLPACDELPQGIQLLLRYGVTPNLPKGHALTPNAYLILSAEKGRTEETKLKQNFLLLLLSSDWLCHRCSLKKKP